MGRDTRLTKWNWECSYADCEGHSKRAQSKHKAYRYGKYHMKRTHKDHETEPILFMGSRENAYQVTISMRNNLEGDINAFMEDVMETLCEKFSIKKTIESVHISKQHEEWKWVILLVRPWLWKEFLETMESKQEQHKISFEYKILHQVEVF